MKEINMGFIYDHINEIMGHHEYDQVLGMIRMARFAELVTYSEAKELKAAALAKLNEIEC